MKRFFTNRKPARISSKMVLALLGSAMISLSAAFGQNQMRVTGSVHDSSGAPLAGAQIVEQGTLNGTATNERGNFNLRVAGPKATLVVTYIGMQSQTVEATEGKELKIVLENDVAMLDEIVAIGYGYVKKSDLTGAVASVKGEEMEDRLVTSVEDALRGRIAGVTITTTDGQPGESLNLRIRGAGSLNASNAPLYVIDGVPTEEPGDLSTNDIESLEILKDASATAIYGSRGANGVVLITTKTGHKGKAKINVQYTGGYQTPVRLLDMGENWEYFREQYIGHASLSQEGSGVPAPNNNYRPFLDRWGNTWNLPPGSNKWAAWESMQNDPAAINTDWQDVMLRNTWMHDFRANVSGGTDESKYSIMGSYMSRKGMVIESGFQKFNLRANFSHKVTRNLMIGFNIAAQKSRDEGAITDDQDGTIMNMLKQNPNKVYNFVEGQEEDDEDDAQTNVSNNNPWFQARNIKKYTNKDNITGKLNIDWQIIPTIRLNVTGNYNYNTTVRQTYYPSTVNQAKAEKGRNIYTNNGKQGWLNENMLYWTPKPQGKHRYDVMAGATFEESVPVNLNAEAQNFTYESLLEWGMNYGLTPINPALTSEPARMASFLGRANYSYDNRYLFTATMRADGSSRFGENNLWGYFPSGAFAWRASEEKFIKSVRWVSNLKLRASVGVTGNPGIPSLQTLPMTRVTNVPLTTSNTPSLGLSVQRIKNPDLKWETSLQYDAAVDFGLFRNRVNGTVEVYYKQTKDLLLRENTPSHVGYTTRWSNVGKVNNKGLEISLNWAVIRQKRDGFTWDMSYNMAFNRSKVVDLGESQEIVLTPGGSLASNYAVLRVGSSLGSFYGYRTDGLFKSYDEIMALPDHYTAHSYLRPTGTNADTKSETITPGMVKYVDQNGDGYINDEDRVILGCGQPKFTGGLQTSFGYKGFALNINCEFSYGRKVFNSTALTTQNGTSNSNQTKNYIYNFWMPDLFDLSTGELAYKGNEGGYYSTPNFGLSPYTNYLKDINLEDGSYLRLSEITLSYNFDKKVLRKLRISGLKLFVGVKNAYVFTKYSGYDPDVSTVGGELADLVPGVDNGSYPRSRIYNLGWSLTF